MSTCSCLCVWFGALVGSSAYTAPYTIGEFPNGPVQPVETVLSSWTHGEWGGSEWDPAPVLTELLPGVGVEEESEFAFPMLPAQPFFATESANGPVPDEAVPEPGGILSIVIGGALIALVRRRTAQTFA